MAIDRSRRNITWAVANETGVLYEPCVGHAQLAVLMDIRQELRQINATLQCAETRSIPRILRCISANTAKPRKARA